ncbi:cryptochrome/photolyase family protein [Robertmurraya korlensis]|uniref:cryptochrome/photolyase family protein n=1 Tax=Robertmurraya korlensis TaxID=519977 RepID=UPI0008247BCB|nr:deoxyribodipyrimidine photo-lyase [Robertmurraya korlensis]
MVDTALYIVRRDLRVHDNAALAAANKHSSMIAVFIYEPEKGFSASNWWLHHALLDFQQSLQKLQIPFLIRKGNYKEELERVLYKTKATAVYWNRVYEPNVYNRDLMIGRELQSREIRVQTFESTLLLPPWTITKGNSKGFKVFTPFYRQFRKHEIPRPIMNPRIMNRTNMRELPSIPVHALQLLPTIRWDEQFTIYKPTEEHGLSLVLEFIQTNLKIYEQCRDIPISKSTSFLSPYLAFGQISSRYIWNKVLTQLDEDNEEVEAFLRQLVWREFSYQVLMSNPSMIDQSVNSRFLSFPWQDDDKLFHLWTSGLTGYPIVDAGMRQLWRTGFMPNRVRMITASFLVKHLLIPWQRGARWFLDTLVDADLAINSFNWQWVAGTGSDAAPFFRIFNPILQGTKFDPEGKYVKRWIPELRGIPTKFIHTPWLTPDSIIQDGQLKLGITYPYPVIEHNIARIRALESFKQLP